ncbi:hypothetical protein AAHA92_00760 [Salvia divinorum]|uniref:Uncharacterized protein n=1 Tax=Salvia divinorum TaxID=28513 RepID=A0ABD1ING8_SALDI
MEVGQLAQTAQASNLAILAVEPRHHLIPRVSSRSEVQIISDRPKILTEVSKVAAVFYSSSVGFLHDRRFKRCPIVLKYLRKGTYPNGLRKGLTACFMLVGTGRIEGECLLAELPGWCLLGTLLRKLELS